MANVHGNSLGIYIDNTSADGANGALGATTYQLIACSTSCSLNLSNATIETACKKSAAGALSDRSVRHTQNGTQSWTMTVDGLVDLTFDSSGEETGFVDLMDIAISQQDVYVAFSTGDTAGTTEYEYWGKAFISSIDATASVDDFATYTVTLEGNGDLAERTVDYGG